MRPQDAQDILRFIESLWSIDLGVATRDAWRPVIQEFDDAAMVTDVVMQLARREVYRPSLALIREAVHKRQQDQAPGHRELPWGRQEIPLWVKRWFYARFRHSPPDLRPFKEQYALGTEPPQGGWMPDSLYVEEAQRVGHDEVKGAFAAGKHMA